jgi:hypothetical protein
MTFNTLNLLTVIYSQARSYGSYHYSYFYHENEHRQLRVCSTTADCIYFFNTTFILMKGTSSRGLSERAFVGIVESEQ